MKRTTLLRPVFRLPLSKYLTGREPRVKAEVLPCDLYDDGLITRAEYAQRLYDEGLISVREAIEMAGGGPLPGN